MSLFGCLVICLLFGQAEPRDVTEHTIRWSHIHCYGPMTLQTMCAWHRCSGTCARQKPEPVIAWALKLKDRSTCLLTKNTYPYLLELLTFAASGLKIYMLSLTSCSLTWTNINITCKLYLIIFLDLFQRWLHYYWSNCRCLPTRGWITPSRGFSRDSTSFVYMSIIF